MVRSFNNRFGNWGSIPAGGFGDTRSPVLRALQNYKRSAAPDDPYRLRRKVRCGGAKFPIDGSAFGDRSKIRPAPRA